MNARNLCIFSADGVFGNHRLSEPWMRLVDELLEDEELLDTVYEAQGERHPQSRSRGRMQTPAEVLLRLLLLKHIRNCVVRAPVVVSFLIVVFPSLGITTPGLLLLSKRIATAGDGKRSPKRSLETPSFASRAIPSWAE